MAQKVLHIILILTVFLSGIGITVNKHYCQKQLRAVGLWYVPASCHETAEQNSELPSCPFHAKASKEDKKNCCEEESDLVKSESDKNITLNDSFLTQPVLKFSYPLFVHLNRSAVYSKTDYKYSCFHPPPDRVTRRVLYQSFQI